LESTGDEVAALQTMLDQLGYDVGTVDGIFGPRTEAAVNAYREWRGFGAGGEADQDVMSALQEDVQYSGYADTAVDADAETGATDDPYAEVTGGDGDPNEAIRQAAIAAAYGEIGLVRAKEAGDVDETGQQTRVGWERLAEYFNVAAPGVWPDDVVKYVKPGLPSWCGIFTLWALKTGGASVGNWGMGTGIPGIRQVTDPQPGDIGYMNENQHYCLVVSVEGDQVNSVDGNTVGDDTVGGEVNDRTRAKSAFAGFFTVF
jgi:peptidoglycan hydrolase-like protein with peptidoglycan-binding domain